MIIFAYFSQLVWENYFAAKKCGLTMIRYKKYTNNHAKEWMKK